MPTEKYAHAPEILEHCRRIGKQFGLYEQRAVPHRGHRAAVGRPVGLAAHHQPGRSFHRPVRRRWAPGRSTCQTPGHSRHRELPGTLVPHQPLGLRLHRRRSNRRALDRAGRQAGRHHRDRRHGRPVHPAPGAGRCGSSTSSSGRPRPSTCATTRPSIPNGSPHRHAGLAAALARELHRQPGRRGRRRGPRHGRLDRAVPPHPHQDHGAPAATR